MSIGSTARSVVYGLDDAWCRAYLATAGDRPGLLAFMFHAVGPDPAPGARETVDPAQVLSVESIDAFVGYFQNHGYTFVTPDQVREGLPEGGRHAMMTFDDGYYNNVRILPVLERRDVPAVFFISTNYLARGAAYWWDVVFRERAARDVSIDRIREEQFSLKDLRHDDIDAYLVQEFGASALDPAGDDDRPMTLDELRTFAAAPNVHIGNHTSDHAILTNYEITEVEDQILQAQDVLESVTGERPGTLSYPNGNYSPEVVAATARCGIDVALTVEELRNRNPATPEEMLTIGRFCFTRGNDHARTWRVYRAGVSVRTGSSLSRLRSRFSS